MSDRDPHAGYMAGGVGPQLRKVDIYIDVLSTNRTLCFAFLKFVKDQLWNICRTFLASRKANRGVLIAVCLQR